MSEGLGMCENYWHGDPDGPAAHPEHETCGGTWQPLPADRPDPTTPHDHRTIVPGCYRCEIGRDEGERGSEGGGEAKLVCSLGCVMDDTKPCGIHHRNHCIRDHHSISIFGRERALLDSLTKVVHAAASHLGDYTDVRETRRGSTFDVDLVVGDEVTGCVARVTVEMLPRQEATDG